MAKTSNSTNPPPTPSPTVQDTVNNAPTFGIELCPGMGTDVDLPEQREGLARYWTKNIQELFGSDSESHRLLREDFFWTADSGHMRLLEESRNDSVEGTSPADVWTSAMKEAESNHDCHRLVESTITLSSHPRKHRIMVDGFDDFFNAMASTSSPSSATHSCLITVLAYLSSQPQACSLGEFPKMKLHNTEASWIVQSGTDGSKPFYSSGIDGTGQVVAVR